MAEFRECAVCDRKRDVIVFASAWGPISHALCRECLLKPAEELGIFRYLLHDVGGGDPTKIDQRIRNWYTFVDGKYVHWDNFVIREKKGG